MSGAIGLASPPACVAPLEMVLACDTDALKMCRKALSVESVRWKTWAVNETCGREDQMQVSSADGINGMAGS